MTQINRDQRACLSCLNYRLNVVSVVAPPLRERKDDIPPLVEHFIRKHNQVPSSRIQVISGPAMESLVGYDWPGNVRELENTIARAMTLARGKVIMPEDLPLGMAAQASEKVPDPGLMALKKKHVEKFESGLVKHYLDRAAGNVSMAAKYAKIPRQSFHRLMKKYRIKNPRFSGGPEDLGN